VSWGFLSLLFLPKNQLLNTLERFYLINNM
jgi:hypothetical protein